MDLINQINKKEKELNKCYNGLNNLYKELHEVISKRTIPNEEVKTFINYLLIYIDLPSCKRILKNFSDNYWYAITINRKYPNVPNHFSFKVPQNSVARLTKEKSNELVDLNIILHGDTFKNEKGEILSPVSNQTIELSIIKNENGIIEDIKLNIY